MKEFVGSLKLELAQYRELEIFSSLASEMDATTNQIIKRGARLVELLNQEPYNPLSFERELILLFAGRNGYIDDLTISQVSDFKNLVMDLFADEEAVCFFENLFELEDEITRDLTLDSIISDITAIVMATDSSETS
jgi:F-type H+-transporting ATPase subunit alpha